MYQNYTICGRLTYSNEEVKYVGANGDLAIYSNTIATSKKMADGQQKTLFLRFKIFGKRAEVFNLYTKKGDLVILQGTLDEESWTGKDDGVAKKQIVLLVDNFTFMPKAENAGNNNTTTGGGKHAPMSNTERGGFKPAPDGNPF